MFCGSSSVPAEPILTFPLQNSTVLRSWQLRVVNNTSGEPRNFVRGGVQQIQLRTEDREKEDLGAAAPLLPGSSDSCNLVQEISFHIVKFS